MSWYRKTLEHLVSAWKGLKSFDPVGDLQEKNRIAQSSPDFVVPPCNELEKTYHGNLLADEHSLKIAWGKGGVTEFKWSDVCEVRSYKIDLITTDQVNLEFHIVGSDRKVVIHEEMAGYQSLLFSLNKYLPGFDYEWLVDTVGKPFETDYRTVWKLETPLDAPGKT